MNNALRSDEGALEAVVDVLSPLDDDSGPGRRYAVLPGRDRPRYLVPVEGRFARGAHIRPAIGRGPGPWSRAAVAKALTLGMGRFLPGSVPVAEGSPTDPSLRRHLAGVVGRDDIDIAVALGAPRVNRKPVIQVIAADGTTVAWVKLGVDAYTDSLVAHETAALERPPVPPVVVPPVLGSGTWHRHRYLVLGHMDLTETGEELHLTADVVRAVAGPLTQEPVIESRWWIRLREIAAEPDPAGGSHRASELLDAIEGELSDRQWPFGNWHGDLAAWNALWDRDHIFLWDWERSTGPVPLGIDLIHNRVQLAMMRDGTGPGDALQLAATAEAGTLEQLGYDREDAWLVALAYIATLRTRLVEDARWGGLGDTASTMAEAIDNDAVLRRSPRR